MLDVSYSLLHSLHVNIMRPCNLHMCSRECSFNDHPLRKHIEIIMDKLIEILSRLPLHPRVMIAIVLASIVVCIFFSLALLSDDRRKRVLRFVFYNPLFYVFLVVAIVTASVIPLNPEKPDSEKPVKAAPKSVPLQEKRAEVHDKKKHETETKFIDSNVESRNVVKKANQIPTAPPNTGAAPIASDKQINSIRAQRRDRVLSTYALAKKLEQLGLTTDICKALADKVERRDYVVYHFSRSDMWFRIDEKLGLLPN